MNKAGRAKSEQTREKCSYNADTTQRQQLVQCTEYATTEHSELPRRRHRVEKALRNEIPRETSMQPNIQSQLIPTNTNIRIVCTTQPISEAWKSNESNILTSLSESESNGNALAEDSNKERLQSVQSPSVMPGTDVEQATSNTTLGGPSKEVETKRLDSSDGTTEQDNRSKYRLVCKTKATKANIDQSGVSGSEDLQRFRNADEMPKVADTVVDNKLNHENRKQNDLSGREDISQNEENAIVSTKDKRITLVQGHLQHEKVKHNLSDREIQTELDMREGVLSDVSKSPEGGNKTKKKTKRIRSKRRNKKQPSKVPINSDVQLIVTEGENGTCGGEDVATTETKTNVPKAVQSRNDVENGQETEGKTKDERDQEQQVAVTIVRVLMESPILML